jgi:hypothetical protein
VKKFLILLVGAAAAIWGTYSIVNSMQKPDQAASGPAATGNVSIVPETVFATSTLRARGEVGADMSECHWFVNDGEVGGVSSETLAPGNFKKGDAVRVEVGPANARAVSPTIVVANTPPRVTSASADLRAEPTATIYLHMAADDVDNDPLTYRYEWFNNGTKVDGESGETIDVSKFKKGDSVHAIVTATDSEGASTQRQSDPVKLGSNAPKITSTPPQELGEGRTFVYQVTAASTSGGSLRYELTQSPYGMTINNRGRIEWTVPLEESLEGTTNHKAVVRVTDSMGGYSTQEFSITTSVQASSASQ